MGFLAARQQAKAARAKAIKERQRLMKLLDAVREEDAALNRFRKDIARIESAVEEMNATESYRDYFKKLDDACGLINRFNADYSVHGGIIADADDTSVFVIKAKKGGPQ